jgi:hypothetical protein
LVYMITRFVLAVVTILVRREVVPCQKSCRLVDLGVYPRSCPSDSCI